MRFCSIIFSVVYVAFAEEWATVSKKKDRKIALRGTQNNEIDMPAKVALAHNERNILLNLSQINYTQDSVCPFFSSQGNCKNGLKIKDTVFDIQNQKLKLSSIPTIKVFMHNNRYYSLDNRRLYVFKQLKIAAQFQVVLTQKIDYFKITTKNCGKDITIRYKSDGGVNQNPGLHMLKGC